MTGNGRGARPWEKCALLAFFLLLPAALFSGAQAEYAFLTYPLEKVRPRDAPQRITSITVRAAGNG